MFVVPSFLGGPRTRQIYNILIYCKIQNLLVRGPFTEERLCARDIIPSATTGSRAHSFPVILVVLSEAKNLIQKIFSVVLSDGTLSF